MSEPRPEAPSHRWYQSAIFYELYVRAFRDSNGDGHGDLRGVIEKLDYLQELGVECIWLPPIYQSPLFDDGYDISDYYVIHPDYGTEADFEQVIVEAHARGMRVITDLVLNHTSDQHPWFLESRSSRTSPKRDWYVWSDTDVRYIDTRIIFLDVETSNWTYDEATEQYYWHRFYTSQPDLNYDNPEVQDAMKAVMQYWLEKGIDGFRVDAVPYLYEREGTNCENLTETHDYSKQLRTMLDDRWPDAIMLAEANQPPADVREYFGDGDEFHMAFHFPLMPRIFMALELEEVRPILEALERTPAIPDGTGWCTFLRNHDELTLEMVTEEERQWMWSVYAPEPRMRLNLGIRRRLAPLLGGNPRRIMLANRILFSLPGSPILYYGDEIGMGDDIDLPDRHGVRTPMQWSDGLNAGFSEAHPADLYLPVINDDTFGIARVNVASQQTDSDSLFQQMKRLIALVKQHRPYLTGSVAFLNGFDPSVLAVRRTSEAGDLVALHNLSARPLAFDLPAPIGGMTPIDYPESGGRLESSRAELDPYGSLFFLRS